MSDCRDTRLAAAAQLGLQQARNCAGLNFRRRRGLQLKRFHTDVTLTMRKWGNTTFLSPCHIRCECSLTYSENTTVNHTFPVCLHLRWTQTGLGPLSVLNLPPALTRKSNSIKVTEEEEGHCTASARARPGEDTHVATHASS